MYIHKLEEVPDLFLFVCLFIVCMFPKHVLMFHGVANNIIGPFGSLYVIVSTAKPQVGMYTVLNCNKVPYKTTQQQQHIADFAAQHGYSITHCGW